MERIHKILARAGVGSRRACEALIEQGRVTVNGRIARLGESAQAGMDELRVDGRRIGDAPAARWIVLNKPPGVVVSDRAQGKRPTARALIDLPDRLIAVGRLDLESEGVVVFTNDGEAAHRLAHPRYEHEKEYRVLLSRHPDAQQIEAWRRGVVLADGHRTRPANVRREEPGRTGRWIRVVLREGHKRQIRETARALGLGVERLIRIRLGPFRLGSLRSGEWRLGEADEIRQLTRNPGRGGTRPRRSVPVKETG
ncbi:MAG TPA: pseudouridine synthase [Anaerolineales bacterium]|nr:pseudouridine synthase [Anaerolineales bacterium]